MSQPSFAQGGESLLDTLQLHFVPAASPSPYSVNCATSAAYRYNRLLPRFDEFRLQVVNFFPLEDVFPDKGVPRGTRGKAEIRIHS